MPSLLDLASKVPDSPEMQVSLVDLAAARTELTRTLGIEFAEIRRMQKYGGLIFLPVNLNAWVSFDDLEDQIGFSFDRVDQVAAWGNEPEKFAVLVGHKTLDTDAINSAVTAQGFSRRDSLPIWSQDKESADPSDRPDNPFSDRAGESPSYAVDGNIFRFALSVEDMVAMREVSSPLSRNPEFAAMLGAIYEADGLGTPVQLQAITGKQVVRATVFKELEARVTVEPETYGAPFPWFRQFAIVNWQDGPTLTGGLAFAFREKAQATLAETVLADLGERPLFTAPGKSFSHVIRDPFKTQMIESSDFYVVLLTISKEIVPKNGQIPLPDQIGSSFRRLFDLHQKGDLGLLLGR